MNTVPAWLLVNPPDQTTWNKRYKLLMEAVHSNDETRAAIVVYMHRLRDTKDLSFGERKLLDLAMNYAEMKAEQDAKVIQIQDWLNKADKD